MKELHPFQLGLLVVCGFLGFVGLLVFANSGGFQNAGQETGVVVIWGTLSQEALDAALEEISQGNDQFGQVSYEQKDEATWRRELADALASGNGPDVVLLSQEELLAERSKLMVIPFTTLPERTFVDSYPPFFELFLTPEGTYGVPFVIDPLVFYYNRSILSTNAIPTPPKTWEAVLGMVPTLTERDATGTITQSAVPFGEYGNVHNARALVSMFLLQSGTAITTEDSGGVKSTLSEDVATERSGIAAAQSAISYYTQFADPAKTVYTWNRSLQDSRAVFLAGDLAFYPGFASELSFIESANPNLSFDMASMPQPGNNQERITYAKGYSFAVPKAATNTFGGMQVALALSSPRPVKVAGEMLTMAPALRSELTPPKDNRYATIYFQEALASRAWLSPAPSNTDAVFAALIGNISSGRFEVGEALETAGKALNAAVGY